MASKVRGRNDEMIKQLGERFEIDRQGTTIITTTIKLPTDLFPASVLKIGENHERFTNCTLTRISGGKDTPGFYTITYTFEGLSQDMTLADRAKTYELVVSLDELPIEAHNKFVTHIAGTPATPLNGAIFIDPITGKKSKKEGAIFKEFSPVVGGTKNAFAGIEAYLAPGAEWRITYNSQTTPSAFSDQGKIVEPDGSPPTPTGRTWIGWGMSYTEKGGVLVVTKTYKLSGDDGWNTVIYGA